MHVEIMATSENPLLSRKEIEAMVSFDGATPTRKQLKEAVCGKVGANPDLVVLRQVKSEFGLKRVKVSAHVYPSAEALKGTEPPYIRVREGMEEKKAKAKKAAAKPAEKKK